MEAHGVVDVDRYGLALRCQKCRKSLSYPIGSALPLKQWEEKKKEFVAYHNQKCKGD